MPLAQEISFVDTSSSTQLDTLPCEQEISFVDTSSSTQLDTLPCEQEISFVDTSSSTQLDTLPCVQEISFVDTSSSTQLDTLPCVQEISFVDTSSSTQLDTLPCVQEISFVDTSSSTQLDYIALWSKWEISFVDKAAAHSLTQLPCVQEISFVDTSSSTQLDTLPCVQEISFVDTSSSTQLDTLPCVQEISFVDTSSSTQLDTLPCVQEISFVDTSSSTQLDTLPCVQEISFVDTSSSTQLDTLPCVQVGKPYATVEAYVDTYMRLHRADCFFGITREMQKASLGEQYEALQAPVFKCIVVCGLVVSDADSSVLKELQANYSRARLIENSVAFVSYASVLDALRTLWTPGCPIELPFTQALLTGKQPPSKDSELFSQEGIKLGIPGSLDEFQLHAYNHVQEHDFALIQGPPGTGKSYIGARLAQVFIETKGRVLVVTTKNHALDEMLLDIAKLYSTSADEGFSKLVRVGNSRKIHPKLQPRSLMSMMGMSEQRGAATRALKDMRRKCQVACARLSEVAHITCQSFVKASGSAGLYTLCEWLEVGWDGKLALQEALSPEQIIRGDQMLKEWAAGSLKALKQDVIDSRAEPAAEVGSRADSALEAERERWRLEQVGLESATAADAAPEKILGTFLDIIIERLEHDNLESTVASDADAAPEELLGTFLDIIM
eukprot:gene16960-23236_t